jgi:hypothetical protein
VAPRPQSSPAGIESVAARRSGLPRGGWVEEGEGVARGRRSWPGSTPAGARAVGEAHDQRDGRQG